MQSMVTPFTVNVRRSSFVNILGKHEELPALKSAGFLGENTPGAIVNPELSVQSGTHERKVSFLSRSSSRDLSYLYPGIPTAHSHPAGIR